MAGLYLPDSSFFATAGKRILSESLFLSKCRWTTCLHSESLIFPIWWVCGKHLTQEMGPHESTLSWPMNLVLSDSDAAIFCQWSNYGATWFNVIMPLTFYQCVCFMENRWGSGKLFFYFSLPSIQLITAFCEFGMEA